MNPDLDGKTHINISSDGKTELGKKLDEFYVEAFIHPVHGIFQHVVGLKCYLRTGCRDNSYRWLEPAVAIERFTAADKVWMKYYMYNVRLGYLAKVIQSTDLARDIAGSRLPFSLYRMKENEDGTLYASSKGRDNLTIDMWTSVRDHLHTDPAGIGKELFTILNKLGYVQPVSA